MIEYRYLKAFILTAKYESFSKAALELRIAQSAVSRQIKLLEENLGEELIIRSSKKVLLTDKGRKLYLASIRFEESTDSLFNDEEKKTIHVGILQGLLENWFYPLALRYTKKTGHNIKIHVDSPSNLLKLMNEGHFDFIISIHEIQNDLISSVRLFNERLVLISKTAVDTSRLSQYRWILFDSHDHFLLSTKKHSTNYIMVNSIPSIINLVKQGAGIALLPDHVLKPSDTLKRYEIPGQKHTKIFLSMLNYKMIPQHLKEMLDIIYSTTKR